LAVGDAAFQQKCYNYFEELKQQRKTVVFVSHDMDAVRRFCNRAIYIDNGNMTHMGTPAEVADVYLEENMESAQSAAKQDNPGLSKKYRLIAKLMEQTENTVSVRFSYKSEEADGMYVGISVLKDGISIAEITTSKTDLLKESGRVTYDLDTSQFNGGMYHIGAGLFKAKNSELLSFTKDRIQFIVKGSDPTKGAALKLADTWKYK